MMVTVLVNVSGWVSVDVSVDDDYADGDEIPPQEIVDALGFTSGWHDSSFEPVSWQADPVEVEHG